MDNTTLSGASEQLSTFKGFSIATRSVELEHSPRTSQERRYGASFSVSNDDRVGLLWRRVPNSVFNTSASASAAALQRAHAFVDLRLERR
jgi:hypothetical protein